MDLLLEILFIFLFDGCFEIISNKDVNIVLRKILLVVITIFYLCLILGFIYLSVNANEIVAKIFLIGVIILTTTILIRLWVKIYRDKVILK